MSVGRSSILNCAKIPANEKGGITIASSSSWKSRLFAQNDLNFWSKENTRSGLTLPNSLGGDPATIQLPYFKKSAVTNYAYVADNGAFDIGNSDLTLYGWVRQDDAILTASQGYIGKLYTASLNGKYGIGVTLTTGKLYAICQSSGGAVLAYTDNSIVGAGMLFCLMEIDQTAKKLRLFVNNIQVGGDVAFTGTFNALANTIEFMIGGMNYTDGGVGNLSKLSSFSDIGIHHRLLSTDEKTLLYNHGSISCDANEAHWPCNSFNINDISGNGFHMTGSGLTAASVSYGSEGSRHGLNYGYSSYELGNGRIDVFNKLDGTPIVSPTLPVGYVKAKKNDNITDADYVGDSLNHNGVDSYINIPYSNWDRSSATNFHIDGRVGKYISTNTNLWHETELKQFQLNNKANSGYQGLNFVKRSENVIKEIIGYNTDKTGNDLKKVLQYCGVYSDWAFIDYYFEDRHVCVHRDNKVLFFDGRYLTLSADGGTTILNTLDLNGVVTQIDYAEIYLNGNICFAGPTKMYYSDDNLETYQESTITGADGNPFVPTTADNFYCSLLSERVIIGGNEIDVIGNYSIHADTEYININAFYTINAGVSWKSFYKVNYTNPVKEFRHIHCINYNTGDGYFYITTGDGQASSNVHILQAHYDIDLDTWEITLVSSNNQIGRLEGIAFHGDVCFAGSDSYTVANHGIYKFKLTDISQITKYKNIINTYSEGTFIFRDSLGNIIVTSYNDYAVFVSKENKDTFIKHYVSGGTAFPAGVGSYVPSRAKNTAGYALLQSYSSGRLSQCLMVKIL